MWRCRQSSRPLARLATGFLPMSMRRSAFATATAPLAAPLHLSRVLRRKERPPMTRSDVANMLGETSHTHEGTTPLELNLFEDPTGGLAADPAEEMSSAEVETHVRLLVPAYVPDLYRLLYTPFVDVVFVVVSEGLVPAISHAPRGASTTAPHTAQTTAEDDKSFTTTTDNAQGGATDGVLSRRPEQIMVRWFTDGVATLKNPDFTREAMGDATWRRFCEGLQRFCAPIEPVQPVPRTVRKHGLREDLFVPLMRQIALNLVEPDSRKATIASLPSFILGLANGRAPASLGLPTNHEQRVQAVAEVFLSTGQETGNTDLAYLGIQLVRANDMAVPYRFQKQLTNVFAASTRIQTDWQFRVTGQLVEAYPRWLDYFRRVAADNVASFKSMSAETPEPLTRRGDKHQHVDRDGGADEGDAFAADEPAREYFASHRRDDVQRSSELQQHIADAVRWRAPLLGPWLQRGTRMRHTTPPALTIPGAAVLHHSAISSGAEPGGDRTVSNGKEDDGVEEVVEEVEEVEGAHAPSRTPPPKVSTRVKKAAPQTGARRRTENGKASRGRPKSRVGSHTSDAYLF